MYRDDPLDDEFELRELIGDDAVDRLRATPETRALETALDILRLLQGWVDDEQAASWFTTTQRRLGGRTPIASLADGDDDEVRDVARRWVAAQG